MHLDVQILSRGSRLSYSYLFPYIAQGRKTIVHVRTIDDVYRCFIHLSRAAEPSERLTQFRMYHAALPDEYNAETLALMENDLRLQVVIGTVAFTYGINVKGILDSLSPRFPETLDASSQEKGRAGRNGTGGIPHGITFVTRAEITAARKQLAGQIYLRSESLVF
jgi:superfamily II DNA helicase RecQ